MQEAKGWSRGIVAAFTDATCCSILVAAACGCIHMSKSLVFEATRLKTAPTTHLS